MCICMWFIPSSSWCSIPWQWLYKQSTDRYTSLINVRSCTEAPIQSENWETKFGGEAFFSILPDMSFLLSELFRDVLLTVQLSVWRLHAEYQLQFLGLYSAKSGTRSITDGFETNLAIHLSARWEERVLFLAVLLGQFNWSIHGSSCSTKFTRACSETDDIPLSACKRLTSNIKCNYYQNLRGCLRIRKRPWSYIICDSTNRKEWKQKKERTEFSM